MAKVTLEQIHKDLVEMKKDIKNLKRIVSEDFELSEDLLREIGESRKRPINTFVSNDDMRKEFG